MAANAFALPQHVFGADVEMNATDPSAVQSSSTTASVTAEASPEGRGMRKAGILVTAIGGGLGAAIGVVGLMMDTCAGAFGDSKEACEKNAHGVISSGGIAVIVAAAVGVPLIVVGSMRYSRWKKEHAADLGATAAALASTEPPMHTSTAYSLPVMRVLF